MADRVNLSLHRSHVSHNSPKAMWPFVGVTLLYAQCITMRDTPSDTYIYILNLLGPLTGGGPNVACRF